jgi:hypothetical protein
MKKNSVQVEMMLSLPASVRKTMNLTDLKVLTGAVLIQDRIAQHFVLEAKSRAGVTAFKRDHGYCGGFVTCMTYTSDGSTCNRCLQGQQNPTRKNKRSEYGTLSKKRKDAEREKARLEAAK